jgi:hypothetical protein
MYDVYKKERECVSEGRKLLATVYWEEVFRYRYELIDAWKLLTNQPISCTL